MCPAVLPCPGVKTLLPQAFWTGGPFCGPRESREVGHVHVPRSLSSPCHGNAVGRERLSKLVHFMGISICGRGLPNLPHQTNLAAAKPKSPQSHNQTGPTRALPEAPCGAFLGAMSLLPSATLQIPPVCIIPSHSSCEYLTVLTFPVPCQIWFKLDKRA